MNSIDAFILVGGRSSRMGRDKASIVINGKSLVERSIDCIGKALGNVSISIVTRSGQQASSISVNVPIIFDHHQDRGPWGGVEAALSRSNAEWTFIMACDYPLMSPDVIKFLVENVSDEFDAIVTRQTDGKLQPLCALYRTSICAAAVSAILAENETPPLRVFFEKVRTRVIPITAFAHLADAENCFLNVNTEADLDKAISLLEVREPFVSE